MTAIALSPAPGTVDRKFTSGLADALGLELVDLRPLEIDIARRCDFRANRVQRWVGGSVFSKANLSRRELTRRMRANILAIAERGDILIVSWSASVVLREPFPAVRVAVRGHRSLRERNASASLHYADIQTASFEVASEDALIARFIQQTFGVDWRYEPLYDLVIDAGGPAKEHAAEAVRTLLTAPRSRPTDTKFTLSPPTAGGHAQAMPTTQGVFERRRKRKGIIDTDAVSFCGVNSHEEAGATVEKRANGCSDQSN